MDYLENILRNSHVSLNKVCESLMEQKHHLQYYINMIISEYLSCNRQDWLKINEAGLQSMERKCYRRVLSIFQIMIPQISQISRIQP